MMQLDLVQQPRGGITIEPNDSAAPRTSPRSSLTQSAGDYFTRAVSVFAPNLALKMLSARQILFRSFDAAVSNRLTAHRSARVLDADSALNTKRQRMLALSREEVRNNPWAKNAKRTRRNNVAGDYDVGAGISIKPDTGDENLNKLLAKLWERYKDKLDIRGRWGEQDLYALATNELFESGEVLALKRYRKGPNSDLPFCIEFLESDRLPMESEYMSYVNMLRTYGGYAIIEIKEMINGVEVIKKHLFKHGIEYDEQGAICAYHLLKDHPGSTYATAQRWQTERFPADEIIFYFYPDRAEQSRGIPDTVASLPFMADGRDLFSWELVAAKQAACLGVHFEGAAIGQQYGQNAGVTDAAGNPVQRFEPGMITFGQNKPSMFQGSRPGGTFFPHHQSITRGIAAGFGMGYSSVAKDYSGGSFSALRQEALEDRRGYRVEQGLLARHFCIPLWQAFVKACALAGKIPIGKFNADPESILSCVVNVPGWEYVNPLQEAKADEVLVSNGFKSPEEVGSQTGLTAEMKIKQLGELKKLADSLGVPLVWAAEKNKAPMTNEPSKKTDDFDPDKEADKDDDE